MYSNQKTICRSFKEANHEWKVTIADDGQVLFSRKVSYIEEVDPFWQSFDFGKEVVDEYTIHVNHDLKLPAISAIRHLACLIIQIIKAHKLQFFYFAANSEKKSRIYEKLISGVIGQLPGKWLVQHIDSHFYITRLRE